MFKVGEIYMIRMLVGNEEHQLQCKILEAQDHLIKIQGRGSDEEPRIYNTSSRNFISAYRVDISKEPPPFDLNSMIAKVKGESK